MVQVAIASRNGWRPGKVASRQGGSRQGGSRQGGVLMAGTFWRLARPEMLGLLLWTSVWPTTPTEGTCRQPRLNLGAGIAGSRFGILRLRGGGSNQPEHSSETTASQGPWDGVDRWVPVHVRAALLGTLSPADRPITRLSIGDADFLHLGHARAALLSDYVARSCDGSLLVRFEEANRHISCEEERALLCDLELLDVQVDQISHARDHDEMLQAACEQALREGRAYVDEMRAAQIPGTCEQRTESALRSSADNLARWAEMQAGSDKYCVRARLNMSSPNPLIRDPILFYCSSTPAQSKDSRLRPASAFSVPILDHAQGVKFLLLSLHPAGRAEQYSAMCEVAGIDHTPEICLVDRMLTLSGAPLDARLLRRVISGGLAQGCDDSRIPTVRGLLRQGMVVKSLRVIALLSSGLDQQVAERARGQKGAGISGVIEESVVWGINRRVLLEESRPCFKALECEGACRMMLRSVEGGGDGEQYGGAGGGLQTVLLEEFDAASVKEGDKVFFVTWFFEY